MQDVDEHERLLHRLRRTSSDHDNDRIVRVDDGFRLVRDFAHHVKWRSNVNMYSPSSQRRDAVPFSSSQYLSFGGMFHKSENVCLCICKFLSAVVRLVYAQIQNTYQSSLHIWPNLQTITRSDFYHVVFHAEWLLMTNFHCVCEASRRLRQKCATPYEEDFGQHVTLIWLDDTMRPVKGSPLALIWGENLP